MCVQDCETCGARKYLAFLAATMEKFEAKYFLRISDSTLVAPKNLAMAAQQVRTFVQLLYLEASQNYLPVHVSSAAAICTRHKNLHGLLDRFRSPKRGVQEA